jgi:tripartite-type tricarboxylate transporter receptor subunit TctC
MGPFRKWICVAASFAVVASTAAHAQNYPTRPVKIIVATGPGGSYDIV